MRIGDLFTRSRAGEAIATVPCAHCPDQVVFASGAWTHWAVDDNGARTAWTECYETVRGKRQRVGTVAAAGQAVS